MPSAFINHNGKLLPAATPVATAAHRAFRYGYSLFETMRWERDGLPLGAWHWKRLFDGLQTALLDVPKLWNPGFLEAEVRRTVRKCGLERARVRLQVGPGDGGLYDREGWRLQYHIECFPLPPDGLNEAGLVLGISEKATKDWSPLSHLKTGSALAYGVAAREALANRWNDALLKNVNGRIGESTIANVFWVTDGSVHTPPLSEGPVAGVYRAYLLDTLPALGMHLTETPLTPETLWEADAVFLTNAVRGIRWVGQVGGTVYVQAPVERLWRHLQTTNH